MNPWRDWFISAMTMLLFLFSVWVMVHILSGCTTNASVFPPQPARSGPFAQPLPPSQPDAELVQMCHDLFTTRRDLSNDYTRVDGPTRVVIMRALHDTDSTMDKCNREVLWR